MHMCVDVCASSRRAPGDFPAVVIMESIIEQVAANLGLDPTLVRERNMRQAGRPGSVMKNGLGKPVGGSDQYSLPRMWQVRPMSVLVFGRTQCTSYTARACLIYISYVCVLSHPAGAAAECGLASARCSSGVLQRSQSMAEARSIPGALHVPTGHTEALCHAAGQFAPYSAACVRAPSKL